MHEGRTLDPRASLAAARVRPWGTLELLPRLRGGGGDGGSTGAESRSCYLEMYAGKKRDKVGAARGAAGAGAGAVVGAECCCRALRRRQPSPRLPGAPRPTPCSLCAHTSTPTLSLLCLTTPSMQVNPEEERLARWTTCQLSGMPLQPPCVADELGSLFNKDAVLQVGTVVGTLCEGRFSRWWRWLAPGAACCTLRMGVLRGCWCTYLTLHAKRALQLPPPCARPWWPSRCPSRWATSAA